MECLGCRLANGKETIHTVYENDLVTCFLDHDPFGEGHTLILPKRHAVELEELDGQLTKAVMDAAQSVAKAIKSLYRPDGITLCQNGGVFNELGHFHMHVVPRDKNRPFSEFYSTEPAEPRNHGLAQTAAALREAIGRASAAQQQSSRQ
ncbi:HIT family protein [Chromobacterium vaccinii]|uniref:HIT family protein n=1 Tax=Chromobacterium vaccinii TaxID=1108595 RepID=A0A1D9LN58_9NEIS|nr:HIT family protein [Chromobacterium vaccinii]AOZ52707.1 HIT family protein [Chromobacterium vaccinii]QND84993.1 HIT family protein [Chromobacterium vaccinii]QND90224.1 HIT family protein [Chromobacterium vaccinii]